MPIDMLIWWAIAALAAATAVVVLLKWDDIRSWFYRNKINYDDYGKLIKKSIGQGKVRVVAGVFNRYGTKIADTSWETENIDSELKSKFGWNDEIRITI
jgi:hypothetical protein